MLREKIILYKNIIKFPCVLLIFFVFTMMAQASQSNPQGQILIFVSSSMPSSSLTQWFHQAQQIHAPVILRGFVSNSLQGTQTWLKSFSQQDELAKGIEINPVAFEAYGIMQVPAVVVTTGSLQCNKEKCQAQPFDVVYGNTALAHALKSIAEKGDAGSQLAKQTLIQLGGT
jgi:conjugal transfer pilus assembly protein TrbC